MNFVTTICHILLFFATRHIIYQPGKENFTTPITGGFEMAFPERLDRAIAEWKESGKGKGKRAFARAMKERGVRGATYRTLLNYLEPKTTPSPKWTEEAADVLGVRIGWLAQGEGKMFVEPSLIRGSTAPMESGTLDWEEFWQECSGSMGSLIPGFVSATWLGAVWAFVWAQPKSYADIYDELFYTARGKEEHPEQYRLLVRLGERLVSYARHPLTPGSWTLPRKEWGQYLQASFLSLQMAAPPPGKGLPLDEYLERTVNPVTVREG